MKDDRSRTSEAQSHRHQDPAGSAIRASTARHTLRACEAFAFCKASAGALEYVPVIAVPDSEPGEETASFLALAGPRQ